MATNPVTPMRHVMQTLARKCALGAAVATVTVGSVSVVACAKANASDVKQAATTTPGNLFDPEALERGAKALREINTSPHAKNVRPRSRVIHTHG